MFNTLKFYCKTIFICFCLSISSFFLLAQAIVTIDYSGNELALQETFSITVTINNEKLKTVSNFPEIEDFVKGNTLFNKEKKKNYTIIQEYHPRKPGEYILKPFYLLINGLRYDGRQHKLLVKDASQVPSGAASPHTAEEESKFSTMKEDAFFAITADKRKIFSGEGFELSAAFYVAKTNTTEINFIDLREQVKNILQKTKPSKCWIEDTSVPNEIAMDSAVLKDKVYTRYLIYSGIFYPLETDEVRIPQVKFTFLTYKVSRTSTKIERIPNYATLSSEPFAIKVQSLPPHPLKDEVAVGVFSLEERISPHHPKAGQTFNYTFMIKSMQGTSTIQFPHTSENKNFDIFAPRTTLKKGSQGEDIKSFEYGIVAHHSGSFSMKEAFQWVFFNTEKKDYDTLFPGMIVKVRGDEEEIIPAADLQNNFYKQMIAEVSNKVRSKEKDDRIKWISNLAILLMLLFTIVLILKK